MTAGILQRYLIREWGLAIIGISLVLFLVVLAVFFGDMLGEIADGELPAGLIFQQLALRSPEALNLILPLAGLLGVMTGLGRLYRDQEMAVMQASGFSWRQMVRPLLILLLPLTVLLLLLGLWLNPLAARKADAMLEEAFQSAAVWGLQPGQFQVLDDGRLVVYVEDMAESGAQLNRLFVYLQGQEVDEIWTAEEGRYWYDPERRERFLSLRQGHKVDITPGQLDLRLITFAENDLKLPDQGERDQQQEKQLERQPSAELLSRGEPAALAELHWRLSPAIAVLILGFLAIPLSHTGPREGTYGRVVLGLLTFAVYTNLLTVGRVWLAAGTLPGFLGLWWLHGALLLAAWLWLRSQGRSR